MSSELLEMTANRAGHRFSEFLQINNLILDGGRWKAQ